MGTTTETTSGAQSLHRSISLLRIVAGHAVEGIRLVDLCKRSGMARTTVHRMLQALQSEGLIEQDPHSDRFHLGREAYLLGVAAESRFGLTTVATATLSALSAISGDISLFLVRSGTHAVCIAREEGTYPVRTHTAQKGDRYPLGVGGGSLAILAACSDAEIDWILDRNAAELERDYPALSPDVLRGFVADTRAQGFAVNPGRVYPQSWGVGLPFYDPQGNCRGSISLAGVRERIEPRFDEVVGILAAEVPRLQKRLYS